MEVNGLEVFDKMDNTITIRHKWISDRVVMIDFRGIKRQEDLLDDRVKRGGRCRRILTLRAFKSVEELKEKINRYFYEADKKLKPYTMSGLARALGVATTTLKEYAVGNRDDYTMNDEQFSDIIDEARQRIEEFAEENLYSKFGFNGAKFVLDVSFGWHSGRDAWAIKEIENNIEVKTEELKLKKQVLEDEDGDSNITINIVRKGE